jgi:TPR repeat protein
MVCIRGKSFKFIFLGVVTLALVLGGCKKKADSPSEIPEQEKITSGTAVSESVQVESSKSASPTEGKIETPSIDEDKLKSEAESEAFIKKVAERTQIEEWFIWGVKYHEGNGVEKDRTKAREYFEKAAEKGHHRALFNLGVYYVTGEGGAKDAVKAVDCFKRAAAAGNEDALFNLAVHYAKGIGVDVDLAKAAEYTRKAAELGIPEAVYNLATMYATGRDWKRMKRKHSSSFRKLLKPDIPLLKPI